MGEVDPAFIQEVEHRPKPSTGEAKDIPLIDISPFINNPNASSVQQIEALISEIHSACKNWGFFQVINHGVPVEKREKLFNVSKMFFDQPLEDKLKNRRSQDKALGYFESEHTKNVRDWKEVFDFTIENPTLVFVSPDPNDIQVTEWFNQWPEYPPELREVCEEYAKEIEDLAKKLMELIALSLGLEANKFEGYFKDQTSLIGLNHYPPCPVPDLALGVGRHKDSGILTILAQDDVGVLQVKRKSDGEWIGVRPVPDAYIINVGDIMQVWSNEIYESVEHRVMVNSERERLSVPYIFSPSHYTNVKPVEELTSKKNPPKYRFYNWGKFLITRKASNFKNLNVENLQIAHFRIPDYDLVERF